MFHSLRKLKRRLVITAAALSLIIEIYQLFYVTRFRGDVLGPFDTDEKWVVFTGRLGVFPFDVSKRRKFGSRKKKRMPRLFSKSHRENDPKINSYQTDDKTFGRLWTTSLQENRSMLSS
ncbi:MAG: hypothetical protein ACREOZ_04940 [Gloeomargaritales cyanobacterium]